jgi:hypothetical protein
MKKIWFAYLVSISLGLAFPALAQDQPQTQTQTNQPQAVVSRALVVHGTVQDVSPRLRTMTVKDPEGNLVYLKFGKEAPDLSQLHKGDPVTATYYASVAMALRKPGEAPTGMERQQYVITSEKGAPGGMVVNSIQTTATVENVDSKKRRIILKDPEGRTLKMKVDKSVQNLNQIKKGDQVYVKYTEAAGVSVTKSQG